MLRHIGIGYEMFLEKNVKKKGYGGNVKPAIIPRKYVATA